MIFLNLVLVESSVMRILYRTLVLLQYIKSYSVYKSYNHLIFCNINSYIQYLHLVKFEV